MGFLTRSGGYKSDHGPIAEGIKIKLMLNAEGLASLYKCIKERDVRIVQLSTAIERVSLTDEERAIQRLKIERLRGVNKQLSDEYQKLIEERKILKRRYKEEYDLYVKNNGIGNFLLIGPYGYLTPKLINFRDR